MIGLMVNSISVMADAFNNLSDAASSIISFIGVKMAQKPADDHHPFGHGRIEYISAFIVAFLVIQVGFSLFKTSIGKIRTPEPMTFSSISVVILLLSIGVKPVSYTHLDVYKRQDSVTHVQDRWEAENYGRQSMRSHCWDTTLALLGF